MNANSLARAMRGNLTYSAEEVKPIDKLMAMGNGSFGSGRESHLNSLGVSLIAFRHAHRADYYLKAVKQLGDALAWRKVKNRGAVSKQAITEYVVDLCPSCCGAEETADSLGVVRVCASCKGSGKRRYEDIERKGIPGKAMQEAHSLISLAISIAIRGATKRLGR